MVPKFMKNFFQIVDATTIQQSRKQKSQSVGQITTFRFNYKNIIEYISVIYLAPDANIKSKRNLAEKIMDPINSRIILHSATLI